jgi:predicted deacylase
LQIPYVRVTDTFGTTIGTAYDEMTLRSLVAFGQMQGRGIVLQGTLDGNAYNGERTLDDLPNSEMEFSWVKDRKKAGLL